MSKHTGTHKQRNRRQYAEQAFERTWTQYYGLWTRQGWAYPDWNDGTPVGRDLHGLTASQPDYLAQAESDGALYHVEVKGGTDRFNAINHRWSSTAEWARFLPEDTVAFLYNSQREEYMIIDALALDRANKTRPTKDYHDGGYFFEWTWFDLEDYAYEKGEVPDVGTQ